jgi:tetratricopeptide (TPR) repeat protein
MAYNKNAWQALAVVLLALIVQGYFHGFKKSHDLASSFKHRLSVVCIIAFIVAVGFFVKGNILVLPVVNYLHTEYSEVGLSWRSTLDIASAVIKEKPVFGIGPNRFSQAYIAHKPTDINLTSAWNAEFTSGFGVIPTFIVTQGLLGAALWLVFMILYLVIMVKTMRRLPADPHQRFVVVSSFAVSLFLWIILWTSIPSHAIIFLTFVLTGAAIGASVFCGAVKPKEINLESAQQGIRRFSPFIPILLIVVVVAWGLLYIKKAIALSFFGSGIKELTVSQDADAAHKAFGKALAIDSSDIYWRAEVEALLSKVTMLVREASEKKGPVSQENVLAVTGTIKQALEASHSAIAYDPANYYNYLSEARVFETAAGLKMENAVDNTIQSYVRAITLNPQNPGLYLTLARFQAGQNKLDEALQTAGAAIKVRPNYLEAIFLVSQIQASKGNLPDAIVAARVATEIDPTNPLLLFQLGFLYYTDKQYGLAAEGLEKALKLQGDYANAQYFLGLAYAYQNRRTDAIAQFEKLKLSNPTNQEVSLILGNLKAGRSPFANAEPPVTSTPEKRSSLPLKEESSD